MDTIMAPVNTPGSEPPKKLTDPEVMAEKLAQAETANFNRTALHSEESPPYQSGFSDKEAKDYYKTMWLPYQALMATALEPCFDAIDKAVAAKLKDWKLLLQKLDKKATAKKRAEAAQDANPNQMERVLVKDLIYDNEVKDLLIPLLQPLVAAIAGKGESLLDCALPPIVLHFLLALDHQHTANWKPRRDRLLEWQLFYYRTQDLHAEIARQRRENPNEKMLPEWEQTYRKNIKNYEDQVTILKRLGENGKAELQALQKLTEAPWQPDLVKALEKQARTRDAEFTEIRQKAIAAFIGARGCSDICTLRRVEADVDSYRRRLHGVLDKLLAAELAIHSLIYRLMNCSEADENSVRRAAKASFPRLQQAWEKICEVQGARHRWKRMVEAEERREKKKNKQKIADENSASSASRMRSVKEPEPVRARMPTGLRQPDIALSEEELAARREKRVQDFLDRYGISAEARLKLGEDVSIPKRMKRELLAMVNDKVSNKVSNKAMLKKAIEILGEELIGHKGEAREELNVLLSTLNGALKELVAPPATGAPVNSPKPRDASRPSNQ